MRTTHNIKICTRLHDVTSQAIWMYSFLYVATVTYRRVIISMRTRTWKESCG